MHPLTTKTRVAGLALLATLLAAAPAVLAQEDPKAVARGKLVEGSDLLKKGEFREALVRFQEAYALVPSPKILYNFGLSYMGLSRNVEAIESFEKFMAEVPDASPDQRANAERFRGTLLQQIGNLIIEANVEGAEISVDGRSRGLTPAPGPIRLDPGPHQLVVEKLGLPPYTRKMSIDAGQKLILEVRITKEAAPAPQVIMMQAAPVAAAPVKPTPTHSWKFKAGIGLGIAAVAVLGYGISQRLSANNSFNDFKNHPATGRGIGQCDANDSVLNHGGGGCDDLLDAGNKAATKATIGLIAGGVLAAGSAALLVLTWKEPLETKEAAVTPPPARRWASLRCSPVLLQPGLACGMTF